MTKKSVDYSFYKVVADGGLSTPSLGEGRFVPALIIDIYDDIEVSELIKLHEETLPGDTKMEWAYPRTFFGPKSIFLNLEFLTPMKINFGSEFHLSSQNSIVDGIIQSRAFYLMTGKSGDNVSEKIQESILIEVPNMGFDKKWNEMLIAVLKKKYRNMGVSRKEIKKNVNDHIRSMREIWNIRRH